jgi:hypothetical protein
MSEHKESELCGVSSRGDVAYREAVQIAVFTEEPVGRHISFVFGPPIHVPRWKDLLLDQLNKFVF